MRRLGAVSDLLFLFEAETREVSQLRSIAERLGLSVQAVSHSYRSLRERGLAELRDGRYRPTVRGVDWLHSALGSVRDDLAERLDRLHIVRTTRAVAASAIRSGDPVTLEIVDGTLTARAGAGTASRGRAYSTAPEGAARRRWGAAGDRAASPRPSLGRGAPRRPGARRSAHLRRAGRGRPGSPGSSPRLRPRSLPRATSGNPETSPGSLRGGRRDRRGDTARGGVYLGGRRPRPAAPL